MAYDVKVDPAGVREQMISDLVAATTETETFHEYQNREHKLPVIVLPLHIPIYRMANFRTRTAQQAYIRREGKGPAFFQQENVDAQAIQHEILEKFAAQGRERSIAPIIDVLKDEKQRQPLLITSRGVVVNGNRRLAAMRSLVGGSEGARREFSHVKCMVLPATITESEIVDIEVRLQMKRRTELDYDWINEAIAIRELRDGGKTIKELSHLMNKPKADIENAIAALAEADLYLSDWRGSPGDYESIERADELFSSMGSSLQSKQGEAQEISRRFAWMLVDRRGKGGLPGRVYNYNPIFGKKAEIIAERLADRVGLDLQDDGGANSESDDEFDVDIDEGGGVSYKPLIALFDDPTRRDDMGEEMLEVWESLLEEERGTKKAQQPLNLIQAANSKLAEVDLTEAAPESFGAIEKQLDAIEGHVSKLRAAVARRKASIAKPE